MTSGYGSTRSWPASLPIRHLSARYIGWALLGAAFVIGLLTANWGSFIDEGDTLVVARLIHQGQVLYKDVFSHHFPFSYYWTAAVLTVAGESIGAVRVSVWLFQMVALTVAMQASRFYLPVGLVALVWSLIRPFAYGNLALYTVFGAGAMFVLLCITLAVLLDRIRFSWPLAVAAGVAVAVALLADPLMMYGAAIAGLFLLSKNVSKTLGLGAIAAGGLLLYVVSLVLTGSFDSFVQSAIRFNSEVYARYAYAEPWRLPLLINLLRNGLSIADPVWRSSDPFQALAGGAYGSFDHWLYTGFMYRLAVLAATLLLLLYRRWRAGAFLLLFAAATLVAGDIGQRTHPFMLTALLAAAGTITQEWWPRPDRAWRRWAGGAAGIVLASAILWLSWRSLVYFAEHRHELFSQTQYDVVKEQSAQINADICGQPDVMLAYYPAGVYQYWFSARQPVAGYTVMWPWVADVALPTVIETLAQEDAKALVIVEDYSVWGSFPTMEYMKPLIDMLRSKYVILDTNRYLSPAAAAVCPRS